MCLAMRRECDNDNNDAHNFHLQWCMIHCLMFNVIKKAAYQNAHAMAARFGLGGASPHAHTVSRLMILS